MPKKGHTLSDLSKLDSTPDTKKGCRGYLAVNLVNDIKFKALKRKKEWNLTNIEAYKLIIAQCYYCGFTPNWPANRVGIDRVDSSIGYQPSNCVPCCFTCNSAKGDKTVEEFKKWLQQAYLRCCGPISFL